MPAKYERVADDIRHDIESGALEPGQRLPAETQLGDRYQVSVPTIRQALGVLRREGLIEARHGIGTYVKAPRQRVRRTTERYQWEKDRALLPAEERARVGSTEHDTGLDVEDLVFHAEYHSVEANDDLAAAFEIPAGTRLLQRHYRTRPRQEKAPLSLVQSFLVYDHVAANPDLLTADNEPWPGGTYHQLRTVGIEIDRVVDRITARPPRADEAELLDIDTGVAVIVLRKTSIDAEGRVVELSDIVMPGDRTELQYTTQLDRWPT